MPAPQAAAEASFYCRSSESPVPGVNARFHIQQRNNVDGRPGVVNNAGTMKKTISKKLGNKRLAVLGAGKIGGILLRAFLEQKLVQPKRVHATVRHAEKARAARQATGNHRVHRQSRGGARRGHRSAGGEAPGRARSPRRNQAGDEAREADRLGCRVGAHAADGKASGHGRAGGARHAQHALRDRLRA